MNTVNLFNNKRLKPFLAAFCAIGWSLAYPLIKLGYREFEIAGDDLGSKVLFAGLRFFFAGLILALICFLTDKKLNADKKNAFGWILLLGVVNTSLHYMFAYIGLGFNSSARSTLIDSSGSFILIIMSCIVFADDKISLKKAIGCLLGFSGIILATVDVHEALFSDISFQGDGMILLNAVFGAFGGIITRIVSKKMNIFTATGVSMAIGGAIMIGAGLIIYPNNSWHISTKGIIILFILIMISAVCFAVYNKLLSIYPISEISIFNALIPVLGVIFSAILLGEEIRWQYITAVLIVGFGVVFVNRK